MARRVVAPPIVARTGCRRRKRRLRRPRRVGTPRLARRDARRAREGRPRDVEERMRLRGGVRRVRSEVHGRRGVRPRVDIRNVLEMRVRGDRRLVRGRRHRLVSRRRDDASRSTRGGGNRRVARRRASPTSRSTWRAPSPSRASTSTCRTKCRTHPDPDPDPVTRGRCGR